MIKTKEQLMRFYRSIFFMGAVLILSVFALTGCAKKTTAASSAYPTVSVQCGSSSCVQ